MQRMFSLCEQSRQDTLNWHADVQVWGGCVGTHAYSVKGRVRVTVRETSDSSPASPMMIPPNAADYSCMAGASSKDWSQQEAGVEEEGARHSLAACDGTPPSGCVTLPRRQATAPPEGKRCVTWPEDA